MSFRFVRRSVGGFSARLPHLFAIFVSLPLVTASEMLLSLSSSEVLQWFALGEGLLEDDSKKQTFVNTEERWCFLLEL